MTVKTILENLGQELKTLDSRLKIKHSFSLNADDVKPYLCIIVPDLPSLKSTFNGRQDAYAYLYIHHNSVLNLIELKEELEIILDDFCTDNYRVITTDDDDKFEGQLVGSDLLTDRIKITILYGG